MGDENKTELEAMATELQVKVTEYLEAFILVGYTVEGDRISIAVSRTEQQADALASLLSVVCDDVNQSVSVKHTGEDGEEL